MLKRIVLYSDSLAEAIKPNTTTEERKKGEKMKDGRVISLKVSNSDWTDKAFDMKQLHKETVLLKETNKQRDRAMFEIVTNIRYLPAPFSLSKVIEFKSRYMIVNKCHSTLHLIQAGCEEKGMFRVYPFETSNFHWTDYERPQEINVRLEDHEYSGNIRIDGIGEIVLRLRGSFENDAIILNVSI